MARKNGKTALIAAIVLVHLCGPEAGVNSEIISAANDREQAGMVFNYVSQIIKRSPALGKVLKVIASKKRVVYHGRNNVYYAISAEVGTKHGMNPAVVIYDELAQSAKRDLYDVLETAQGAQEEPLFMTISTQSHDPSHPLSEMIDDALTNISDSTVCHLYAVPESDDVDVFAEENWADANPAIGDFRSLTEMREYAAKAKRLPAYENVFRNLYCNQRVSLTSTLFSRSLWESLRGEPTFEDGEEVILAMDNALRIDFAALAMLSVKKKALKVFFWKPEDLLQEHGSRDRKDYFRWRQQGFLEPCPGKIITGATVAMKIAAIHSRYKVVGFAYDRWRIDDIIKELDSAGISASKEDDGSQIRLYPWGQGVVDMGPAVDAFEEAGVTAKFEHDGNPVLTWNVANAIIAMDAAGNRKLDKSKSRLRIDGAVAATMAFGLRAKLTEHGQEPSFWESM